MFIGEKKEIPCAWIYWRNGCVSCSSIRMRNGSLGANSIHKTKHIFLVSLFFAFLVALSFHRIGRCISFVLCDLLAALNVHSNRNDKQKSCYDMHNCFLHSIRCWNRFDREISSRLSRHRKSERGKGKENRDKINENEAICYCCAFHFAWVRVCDTKTWPHLNLKKVQRDSFQIYSTSSSSFRLAAVLKRRAAREEY